VDGQSRTGGDPASLLPSQILHRNGGRRDAWRDDHGETITEDALKGVGVEWPRTVRTCRVEKMRKALIETVDRDVRGRGSAGWRA